MLKRLLVVALAAGCFWPVAARAVGATIYAELFPHTGEVRLRNRGVTPISIVFYSIESPSGALNSSPSVWRSIDNFYDASGNGFIDPDDDWVIISALSTELSEGVFIGDGGSLAPQRAISLGRIWNPNLTPLHDLIFEARETNEQAIVVSPEYEVNGDYLRNGIVDHVDYNRWRQHFGSTTFLFADGNLDGVVDAADYVVWRKNLGLSLTNLGLGGSLSILSAAVSVPEPSAAVLMLAACGALYVLNTRRARPSGVAPSGSVR